MTQLNWRSTMGKALRPALETTVLDRVKYLATVRRFARDWAIAFGFWDDGVLAKEPGAGPAQPKATAATRSAAPQARVTVYVDPTEAATSKLRELLGELAVPFREVDISQDQASRKWLAEENDGARPPQLFLDGRRIGGLDEARDLHARGELRDLLTSSERGQPSTH